MGFYPTREAVQKSLGFETATQQPTDWQHYTVTFILYAVLLATGVVIRSLGKVYALVGGLSATTLSFILPGAAYLVTRRCTNERVAPILTSTTVVAAYDDFDKTPVFQDTASVASSSRYFDEEDASTVNGTEPMDDIDLPEPSRWLDIAAGLLIVWGFMVMFFSTSGVFTQP